ncbi:MAG: NADH-quinone oxidoreductase subunit C [Acidimicrobiales bacterium]|nr:NADH-quinone oxidoreductase subunit C [Acidimicrobiales bacterium]
MSDETAAAEEAEAEAVAEEATVALRYGAAVSESHGDVVLHATVETYLDVCGEAHADGFDQLIDLTAVDYLTYAGERTLPGGLTPERFEVVTSLINHVRRERIRIRTQVSADEPTIPSLFDLWPGSEYLEREAFDMFGITFADHPDMSRVLMPEDWVGHPLRKDYAVGAIPVQFKAASNER